MASTTDETEDRQTAPTPAPTSRRQHQYGVRLEWTGNLGTGTSNYRAYGREHTLRAEGKPAIAGSSDPAFRGDASRWNPEEFLVSALSSCHMLAYLHLCAVNGVVVSSYRDEAQGIMRETSDGGGAFVQVTLRPAVTVAPGTDMAKAAHLHYEAHEKCFIAASVNFPVQCDPQISEA